MALEKMYPPQKDSPSTYLMGDIGTEDTYILIGSADVLPKVVPFPMTIGFDKSVTETVIVTNLGNGNNQLTVIRGDTPLSWTTGARCARVFTSQDLQSIQNNISKNNQQINENLVITNEKYNDLFEGLTNEIDRANAADADLELTKINRSELTSVVTGVELSSTSSAVSVTFTTYDANNKLVGQTVKDIPIVTDSNVGVITPEDYSAIGQLRTDVNALQQQGGKFIGQSFPTYVDLIDYTIPSTVNVGDFTYILDDEGHSDATTRYIYNGEEFEFAYVINYDPVGVATVDTPGIVKSNDGTSNGYVVVEVNGSMRVVGWNELNALVSNIANGLDQQWQLQDEVIRLINEHKAYQTLEDSEGNPITDSTNENVQGQFIFMIK